MVSPGKYRDGKKNHGNQGRHFFQFSREYYACCDIVAVSSHDKSQEAVGQISRRIVTCYQSIRDVQSII